MALRASQAPLLLVLVAPVDPAVLSILTRATRIVCAKRVFD